jgi:hypothetical protein
MWKFQASRGWVDSFISRHSAEMAEKKRYAVYMKHSSIVRQTWRLISMKLNIQLGGSKTEESCASNHRQLSQHSPSNISERETHLACNVDIRGWRVSYSVHCYISGFCDSSPGSRGNWDPDWEAFDLETPRQTLRQCWSLRKLYPNRGFASPCYYTDHTEHPWRRHRDIDG